MTNQATDFEVKEQLHIDDMADCGFLKEESYINLKENTLFSRKDSILPEGFASAADLLSDFGEEINGNEDSEEEPIGGDELIKFAREEAADGGQGGSADYAQAITKDLADPAFKKVVDSLTHSDAMDAIETLRNNDSNKRLEESELRRAYSTATNKQKAAILYALKNFDSFAEAGNWVMGDFFPAIDDCDIKKFKQPGK